MKEDLGELINLIWNVDKLLLKDEDDASKMITKDYERITEFLKDTYLNKYDKSKNPPLELTEETAKWLYHELDNEITALKIKKFNSTNEKENDELDNLIKLEAATFRLYKRNSSNISKSKKGGINFLNEFLSYYSNVGVNIFNRLNLKDKLENSQYNDYKKLKGYFKSVHEEWQKINKKKITEERMVGFLDYISNKGWNLVRMIKKEYNNNVLPVRTYLNLLDKVIDKYDELVLRDAELRNENMEKKRQQEYNGSHKIRSRA